MDLRLISPLLIAALIALPGCSRPRPAPARPALFVVRDADTVIWVLGTIHALPAGVTWETPAISRAIDSADTLVTEIPPTDPEMIGGQFNTLAHSKGLLPILDRVSARLRAPLARAIDATDPALRHRDTLESWAAALTIENARVRAAGATSSYGVEAVLAQRFAGRPHRAFETPGSQLALFDQLSADDQRRLLEATATEPAGYRTALAAWSAGDVAAMARSNDRLFAGAPAIKQALLTARNARWSSWIARRMRKPGVILVAVGAGHMVGNGSVVDRLQRSGLKVQRVQ